VTTLIKAFAALPQVAGHGPWPRRMVDETIWEGLAEWLANGHGALLGLWGDATCVHMALLDAPTGVSVASLFCSDNCFPSVGALHTPAIRFERAIRDLYGHIPFDAPDDRPWLDHAGVYPFLQSEGEGLHQIPVGPVHAGIIEPGHFRFTCNGETIVRLEARLGYVHKGIEALMVGAPLDRAARIAARCSGDSTVAYSIAFARAAEAALRLEVPERGHWLRALMAELERISNHLGDIGAICNDAAFALMLAQCATLREKVLRTNQACFGHRLMMDAVAPGGVTVDLDEAGARRINALVATIRAALPRLIELYDNTASLQDRTVATGFLKPELARKFGAGGFIGRGSGRDFDARRDLPYPPYDRLRFDVPVFTEGDVNARVWVRIREVEQSLGLIAQILERLPPGDIRTEVAAGPSEGLAVVEGFRGDVLVWLRLGRDGAVERCHLRDPSWLQWPLLEAAVEGNIVADFPLCNKSFNCSYSGHDL